MPRDDGPLALIAGAFVLVVRTLVASGQQGAIWHDPGDIASKDLRWGVGSQERAPKPPFKFVKEDLSGSKPKIRVTDANGVSWNVKFAGPQRDKNEVHPEIAANRIASALGFFTEEDYYVAEGQVEGAGYLQRANSSVGVDGSFKIARFERRSENVERLSIRWTFADNPFAGSKELSGLKLVVALVNNWDDKPDNVDVDRVTHSDGSLQERYLITDWGASFGRMSGPPQWSPAPTRWRVDHYRAEPFVKGIHSGNVRVHYIGQMELGDIPIEHARWFLALAEGLTTEQVRGAFAAAGASPDNAQAFATRVIEKINELKSAIESSAP